MQNFSSRGANIFKIFLRSLKKSFIIHFIIYSVIMNSSSDQPQRQVDTSLISCEYLHDEKLRHNYLDIECVDNEGGEFKDTSDVVELYYRSLNSPSSVVPQSPSVSPVSRRRSCICCQYYLRNLNVPYMTVVIVIIVWSFYLYGVIGVIGWRNAIFSATGPISPPQTSYQFYIVEQWPSCADKRKDVWRLLSFQFVHEGLYHIGGNTAAALYYGALLEMSHFYGHIVFAFVFELGVIFGAIGFAYVWPFQAIVGCSSGVYAVIAACLAHLILNHDTMNPTVLIILSGSVFMQILSDTCFFFLFYNAKTAYVAHATGFFIGFSSALGFGVLTSAPWKKVMGIFGILGAIALSTTMLVNYVQNFPPAAPNWNPTVHSGYSVTGCCEELYRLINATYPLEIARGNYYCNGDDLQPYVRNYQQ